MAETPSTRLSFGEHEVWITVDAKELECYGIERDEEKKQLTCWIPSEVDKPFSVWCKKLTKEFPSGINIYMDGNLATRHFLREYLVDLPQQMWLATISPSEARDFRFGVLEMTDDDTYLDRSDCIQHLGEIKVDITKVIVGEIIESTGFGFLPETKKVHERSKKALRHKVEYGEKRAIQPTFWDVVEQEILGTFIFKYRPFAMLQANGLVPRAPSLLSTHQQESHALSPPPPVRKRKASATKHESGGKDHSNDEGDLENSLLERLSSIQAELEQIRSKKRAKRQGGSSKETTKAESKPNYVQGEIIDLT